MSEKKEQGYAQSEIEGRELIKFFGPNLRYARPPPVLLRAAWRKYRGWTDDREPEYTVGPRPPYLKGRWNGVWKGREMAHVRILKLLVYILS